MKKEDLIIAEDFFLALDQLEKEKRLNKALLLSSIEVGLASAFKKETGESRVVAVKINEEKRKIEYYAYRTVVPDDTEEIDDGEMYLYEALEVNPEAKIGDIIGEDITPKELSRIAAQTGKQVIMQKVNEAISEQIKGETRNKEGEIVQAIIRRIEKTSTYGGARTRVYDDQPERNVKESDTVENVVYVEIIGTQMEGILKPRDQVPGEKYQVNDKIKVYVKKVRENFKGVTQVDVSRSDAGFVKKLYEFEVPEIKSGLVKIKSIVREAGVRTKIAVYTEDPNLDPIAACVGPKGSRVISITSELSATMISNERIDIIQYSGNIGEYVARALSPAKPVLIKIDHDEKGVTAVITDDKLSLAIGKQGVNVRLAARLTGVKIDLKRESELGEESRKLIDPNNDDE